MSNPTENRQMTLKKEFKKAYQDWYEGQINNRVVIFSPDVARWAACWMAEYLASHNRELYPDEIRQLAKELK